MLSSYICLTIEAFHLQFTQKISTYQNNMTLHAISVYYSDDVLIKHHITDGTRTDYEA